MMEHFKHICAYLTTIGLLPVFFFAPFPYGEVQRLGLYVAGIGFVIDYIVNHRWQQWSWSRDKWAFLCFVFFYCCLWIHPLLGDQLGWLYRSKTESYLPFLIFGVVGLAGCNHTMKIEYVAATMLLGCVTMVAVLGKAMWGVPMTDGSRWLAQLNEQRIDLINSHMVVNVYCNMTLVMCAWMVFRSSWPKWTKWIFGIGAVGIIGGLTLSEGRAGQITTILILLGIILYWLIQKRYHKWILPLVAALGILAGIMWHINPHFHDYSLRDNPRLYVWSVAQSMIQEKPVLGWGIDEAREEFIRRGQNDEDFRTYYMHEYEMMARERFGEVDYTRMDPHSAFLETWMEWGVIGLIIFVLCLVLPIVYVPNRNNRVFLAMIIVVFAIQAFVGCMGRGLSPIWVPLMMFIWTYNRETEKTHENSL